MIDIINRILNPIRTKIYTMIGHAILTAVENQSTKDGVTITHPLQHLRIESMANEVLTGVQRVQEYGLETYPSVGDGETDGYPEAVALFLNGDKENGIVICVGDRRYRITDLAEGEVALYTKWNENTGKHSIKLKTNQEIEMNGANLDINISDGIDDAGDTITGAITINCSGSITVTSASAINLDGGTTTLTGVVNGACICPFTGNVHSDVSSNVKCSK